MPHEPLNEDLKSQLQVGTFIEIGPEYASGRPNQFAAGQVVVLIEGCFEYDNGLYEETRYAPSVWSHCDDEYDSIYHLFGNDLDGFSDCKVIGTPSVDEQELIKSIKDYIRETCSFEFAKETLCTDDRLYGESNGATTHCIAHTKGVETKSLRVELNKLAKKGFVHKHTSHGGNVCTWWPAGFLAEIKGEARNEERQS